MRRRDQDGYTLIEILVVLAILVLVVAGASLGIGSITRANLRSSAMMLGAAVRTGYTRAVTQGHAVRLVMDLGGQKVWLEETEDRLVLSRDPEDSAAGASQSATADGGVAPPAEEPAGGFVLGAHDFQIGASNTPRYRGAQFHRIEGSRFEPRDMPRGVRLLAVYTAHTEGRQEEGVQYLYFWPGGMTERAVIQVADADDGTTFSVVVHPLTGRAGVVPVPVEPEADLTEEEDQPEEARDDT